MREEIYQKFKPIGKEDLKQYVKKLNIGNRSYDSEKRKNMLLRWASVLNCKWLKGESLQEVLYYIENNEAKLPTPLTIKDFAFQTQNIIDKHELCKIIDKYSQRTPERFALEIKGMEERKEIYKIVFLCFPFISHWFSYNFIKIEYNRLLQDFGIEDSYALERIHSEFQDRIDFGSSVGFSHPSYFEALPFILFHYDDYGNSIPTTINTNIFRHVLIKLSDSSEASWEISEYLSSNFNDFKDIRNDILLKLVNHERAYPSLADILYHNFDNIPHNIRNKLLLDLVNNSPMGIAGSIANTIASNYDKLPDNVRNLLFKMSSEEKQSEGIPMAIASNYDKLPDNVRNLLFGMVNYRQPVFSLSGAIASNYDKLPDNVRNLLFEISKKKNQDVIRNLAFAIASNYDKLPDNVRNLLSEFTKNVTTAAPTIFAIISYYNKLPDNVKELVFELVKDKQLATAISYSILTNLKQLPDNVKELVFNLADDEETAADVAVALREKLNSVPLDIENRLGAILRKYNLSYDRWWED